MMIKCSNQGVALIKRFEGKSNNAYLCPAGKWTIGYGRIKGVSEGMAWSDQQCEDNLISDLREFELGVTRVVSATLNQAQFDSLVSFAFNLGIGALKGSTLLRKVNSDPNDPTIRHEFNKWVNCNGKPLSGLIRRRAAEADLYFSR